VIYLSCSRPTCIVCNVNCTLLCYRIAAYFRKVFIFGYFERAFLCENKFQRIIFLRKLITTIDSTAPECVHVINFLYPAWTCLLNRMSLYCNLDPEGPLPDVLPSSTIKAANDAVLAVSQQPERVVVKRLWNNRMSR